MPFIPSPQDVAEVVRYAIDKDNVDSIQITGGSTFEAKHEEGHITAYMTALNEQVGRSDIRGEILLYITPPENTDVIDRYFELGADRIACSLEVWDDGLAKYITPGKYEYTTKKRHLDALEYIAEKYASGRCFPISS